MTRILDGAPAARSLLEGAEWAIENAVRKGRPRPLLASVHRPGPSPFSLYLAQQAKAAQRVGAAFRDVLVPDNPHAVELPELLARLDAASDTHGILLEHPMPSPWPFREAIARVRPEKDIDGVSPGSLGRLAARRPIHVPAVARGALRLAEHHGVKWAGKRVAVVGRSETVGTPLALLLGAPGPGGDATVTVAHSKTPDLAAALSGCSILFSAAGRPGLLDRTNVPRGASVIDLGISSVPDPARPGRQKAVGDANSAELEGWAEALSPVPGGVGPVTVAALFANLVAAWELLTGPAGVGGPP